MSNHKQEKARKKADAARSKVQAVQGQINSILAERDARRQAIDDAPKTTITIDEAATR